MLPKCLSQKRAKTEELLHVYTLEFVSNHGMFLIEHQNNAFVQHAKFVLLCLAPELNVI